MNRTDRQPEKQLIERLAAARTTLNELRTPQPFGGSDIRLYRLARSDGQPDITLTNLTSTTPQGVQVTVTPLAGNPISVPTPVLDLGFASAVTPSTAVSYYALTRCSPGSDGSQRFYIYFLAASTTLTSMALSLNFWTFVPASYTVTHL